MWPGASVRILAGHCFCACLCVCFCVFTLLYDNTSLYLCVFVCPAFLIGQINSLVHVVMYLYYGLAAVGPHMHKFLWWKRYLTSLQLVRHTHTHTHTHTHMQAHTRTHTQYILPHKDQALSWTKKAIYLYLRTFSPTHPTYSVLQGKPWTGGDWTGRIMLSSTD